MASFNGHKSWNAWNVSLWINNDEGLYNMAVDCKQCARTLPEAARGMLEALGEMGIKATPDGGRYNVSCIMEAIREI